MCMNIHTDIYTRIYIYLCVYIHSHWRSCPTASHRRVLLLAASRQAVALSPFRISGNCSRKNQLKHGFARPRRCAIGPCVPVYAIGRREPPVLHGHWRSCPMAPHRMVSPWLAASHPVVLMQFYRTHIYIVDIEQHMKDP